MTARASKAQTWRESHIAGHTSSSVKTCELLDMLNRTLLVGIRCFQLDEHLKNLEASPARHHQVGNNFKIHSETITGDFCALANSLSVAVKERKGGVLQGFYTNTGFLHLLWNGTV